MIGFAEVGSRSSADDDLVVNLCISVIMLSGKLHNTSIELRGETATVTFILYIFSIYIKGESYLVVVIRLAFLGLK